MAFERGDVGFAEALLDRILEFNLAIIENACAYDIDELPRWRYDELPGDSGLMQRFVDGCWNESEFLVVEPGRRITEDVINEGVVRAE